MRQFLILLIVMMTSVVGACGSNAGSGGKPVVLCSIFAYFDAARAIGGEQFDVRVLMPVAKSPHEYESTVSDKITVSKAVLYVKNGMGLDDRFDKLLDGSKAQVVTISDALPKSMLLQTDEMSLDEEGTQPGAGHAHEGEHAHGGAYLNPHIWLDPQIQMKAAEAIRDAMIHLDPANKAAFEQNATKYLDDLRKLDADLRAETAAFKNKDFIGFHSAYDYLAHRYGLRQIASIEELPGSDVTVAQTDKLIRLIKDKGIKYIAVESAFSANSAALIERETGAKEIILQPLETYDDAKDTYIGYMRKNLEALKTMLGG
jgi:zinc transport system substrate-binding protein